MWLSLLPVAGLFAMATARQPTARAALLTASFGAMQAVMSIVFGAVIDHYGYAPICVATSLTPLCAFVLLHWTGVDRRQ